MADGLWTSRINGPVRNFRAGALGNTLSGRTERQNERHSEIEWTDATWNPVRGCTKISPGCDHCYAETFAERFRGVPGHPYEQGFDLRLVPEKLAEPLAVEDAEDDLRQLDERPVPQGRARRLRRGRLRRSWNGQLAHLSGADQAVRAAAGHAPDAAASSPRSCRTSGGASASRTGPTACRGSKHLRKAPAAVRFLSIEPLLEDLGEIEPGRNPLGDRRRRERARRPADAEGMGALDPRSVRSEPSVPFFFKQWGGVRKSVTGRKLDGRTYDEFPARVQHPVLPASECVSIADQIAASCVGARLVNVSPLSSMRLASAFG